MSTQAVADSVEKILRDAGDAVAFTDGWVSGWILYERFKRRIQDLNLDAGEYEAVIRQLTTVLHV